MENNDTMGLLMFVSGKHLAFVCIFLFALSGGPFRVSAEPAEARNLADLAREAMARENWERADAFLEQALRLTEDAPDLWIGRGFTRTQLGKIEDTRESFKTALKLYREKAEAQPGNVGLIMNVGYTLVLLNRRDEALAYLEQAGREHPEHELLERFEEIVGGLEASFAAYIVPEKENGEDCCCCTPGIANDAPAGN